MQLINETETQALTQLCQLSTAFHSQIGGLLAAPQKHAVVHSDATISTRQLAATIATPLMSLLPQLSQPITQVRKPDYSTAVKKPASSLPNPERKQPSGPSEHTEPRSINP